jgi:hypothetical protein
MEVNSLITSDIPVSFVIFDCVSSGNLLRDADCQDFPLATCHLLQYAQCGWHFFQPNISFVLEFQRQFFSA